jgi:hypothetical protein
MSMGEALDPEMAAGAHCGVHVVAIHRLRGNEELLARELASVLGKTVLEARARVRTAAAGPAVVGVFATPALAAELAGRLTTHGFEVMTVAVEGEPAAGGSLEASSLTFTGGGLRAVGAQRRLEVRYSEVDFLLCGTRSTLGSESHVVTERKFSPVRLVLSGGLMLTSKVTKKRTVVTEERERFVYVYAGSSPVIVLRQGALSYRDTGLALAPTRAENFSHLIAELRQRCPAARHDERLNSRAAQVQMLGGSLPPDRHIGLAIALLTEELRSPPVKS